MRDEAEARTPRRRARILAFIGARGGVGTSTLALGTRLDPAHEHNLQTALIDLDLHFGNLALSLDLEPGRGLRQALEHPERTDSLLLASAMVKGDERLPILAAEESLEDLLRFEADGATALLTALAQDYECLVVDLPRSLDGAAATCSPPPTRDDRHRPVAGGAARRVPPQRSREVARLPRNPIFVGNQVGALHRGEIGRAEFERGLGAALDFAVPFDPKAARAMAVSGKALPARPSGQQGRGGDAPHRRAHRRPRGEAKRGWRRWLG